MSVMKAAWQRIKHAFTGKSATTLDNWRDLAEFLGIGDVPKKPCLKRHTLHASRC